MVDRELGMFSLNASLHDRSCLQPTRSKQSAFRSGTRQKTSRFWRLKIIEARHLRQRVFRTLIDSARVWPRLATEWANQTSI
jgi:hypothetical protein